MDPFTGNTPPRPRHPGISTLSRILNHRGFITPQPHKRPHSSWKRFEAEQPNQSGATILMWTPAGMVEAV